MTNNKRLCVCMYIYIYTYIYIYIYIYIYSHPHTHTHTHTHTRGGADKSLVQPGRKQATAAKLGIYSTSSPQSSIHFLARCCNISSHSKKFRSLSVQPGLRGSNDLRVGRKMATFQLFFQSREQVVVRRGQIRRIGWVIKRLEPR